MFDTDEKISQLNVRLPDAVLRAIEAAASQENRTLSEYVRLATLTAVCHTYRGNTATLYISPQEEINLPRAQALGMRPITEVGSEWLGEVRIPLSKNGLYRDTEGGLWVITPQGLKLLFGAEFIAPQRESRQENHEERTGEPRPEFLKLCEAYKQGPVEGFPLQESKQTACHLYPREWKSWARFSFIDLARHSQVGIQLFVRRELLQAAPELLPELEAWAKDTSRKIDWRPSTGQPSGARLRWVFSAQTPNKQLCEEMKKLIQLTKEKVGTAIGESTKKGTTESTPTAHPNPE